MSMVRDCTKRLQNGEVLELYHDGDTNNRVCWIDNSKLPPAMLDYRDFKSYTKALAFFKKAK